MCLLSDIPELGRKLCLLGDIPELGRELCLLRCRREKTRNWVWDF